MPCKSLHSSTIIKRCQGRRADVNCSSIPSTRSRCLTVPGDVTWSHSPAIWVRHFGGPSLSLPFWGAQFPLGVLRRTVCLSVRDHFINATSHLSLSAASLCYLYTIDHCVILPAQLTGLSNLLRRLFCAKRFHDSPNFTKFATAYKMTRSNWTSSLRSLDH